MAMSATTTMLVSLIEGFPKRRNRSLKGETRPRVEGDGVRCDKFFEYTSVLTLARGVVRRAEEYSAILKLRTTECGGLLFYTILLATNLLVALIDRETK